MESQIQVHPQPRPEINTRTDGRPEPTTTQSVINSDSDDDFAKFINAELRAERLAEIHGYAAADTEGHIKELPSSALQEAEITSFLSDAKERKEWTESQVNGYRGAISVAQFARTPSRSNRLL